MTQLARKPSHAPTLQYALLAVVALVGLVHVVRGTANSFRNLAQGTELAIQPVYSGSQSTAIRLTAPQAAAAGVPDGFALFTVTYVTPPAKKAGIHVGDAIFTVDGLPYTGLTVMLDAVARRRPGDTLPLTFWRAGTPLDAKPAQANVPLTPQRIAPPAIWAWGLQALFTIVPAVCLLTGLYVVFALPRNINAWLTLGILSYLSAFFLQINETNSPFLPLSLIWITLGQTAMPLCFMLLSISFPTRLELDRRFPSIKWLFLAPILLLLPFDLFSGLAAAYRVSLIAPFAAITNAITNFENILSALAIFFAFYCFGAKLSEPGITPDARRRLRVLVAGCSIGLTPLFFLVVNALAHGGGELSEHAPRWATYTVFALLLVFPLTLAYVVVVQRAMDLRILIRQGTKYFFARQSVFVIGALIATWMSIRLSLFFSTHNHRRTVDIVEIFGLIGLFIAYRTIGSKRLQARIDQKFFREAYSTEQILSELSDEARNFTAVTPLLQTITRRVAETLHIDRVAVFLRAGDVFQLEFATGLPLSPGYLPALPAASTTITHLVRGKSAPATVYRDDPSSWLVDATDAERTALADLSTELLVPLPGRNRLVGVIALGPKSSEEPYSKSDRQLLQSVASQTGLALENAELLENLTAELAQRASINREIEIAREVQERLFPQTYPQVRGVDLCGFCRPAQFVGGDYYDFFLIPQPGERPSNRLAIAIGDISGKGISAALLMASLRASLRAVATQRQSDEAPNQHLATLIQHVNRLVYEASTANRYATFFYAELDPETRLLTYVNAGHNCPVVLRHGQPALQLQPTGTVVGLMPDAAYDQATLLLQPGDTLLAFTDGISEAMTADDEEWGEERMTAAAQSLLSEPGCTHTAHQLLECILAKADSFTAGAAQHDDMTLLVCTIA